MALVGELQGLDRFGGVLARPSASALPSRPLRLPLSVRFLAVVLPVLTAALLAAMLLPALSTYEAQRGALDQKLSRMVQNQSIVISRAVATLDNRMTGLVMAGILADRDVVYVEITGPYGQEKMRLGSPPAFGRSMAQPISDVDGGNVVPAGTLRMGMSYNAAWTEFMRSLEHAVITALVAALALCLGTWLTFRALIDKRIAELHAAIDRWRNGEPATRRERPDNDALDRLGRAFDTIETERRAREQVLRDVRDALEWQLRERNAALSDAHAEAERTSRAKTDFLAAVSHEIRTPLNAVLGVAHTLVLGDNCPDEHKKLAVLRESGETLRVLLDDVLDLSKAEAGCMQVEPVAQELKALIASICAFWREEAAQQGLSFDVVLAPDLPERIMVDPTRLTQAVSNLLSNAIKFTKDGGVRVEVDGRPKGSRWELSISVTDTGIGISADTQARLFQTFTQGDSSITRRYGGTGVGLALTRHIVVLMDGRIAVESAPGAGSTFRITLPVSLPGPSAAKPAPAATPGAMAELAGLRVLVIDDVETNRFVARLMLEPVGAIVSEAASGAEGLALLREQDFDLALVDLHMPDLDGIETVRRLRAEPRSAALPVLLLTADATWRPGPDIACLSIAGTVMKPVEPDTLHDAIRSAATGSRAQPSKDRAIH